MSTGFAISRVVKENPKKLTVNFGGQKGMQVRKNYLRIQEMVKSCATANETKLFNGLHAASRSYTFHSEDGLLSMTQFAQPAILVTEKAAFEHLKHLGRVPPDSVFAGHSLGEFAALSCMTPFMPLKSALKTVFVRGILMQAAVPRDGTGRSGYAMVAVDPSRITKSEFNKVSNVIRTSADIFILIDCREEQVLYIVSTIAETTGLLIQMVNLNVRGSQYVCAGDKRCLEVLRKVIDEIHHRPSLLDAVEDVKTLVVEHCKTMESSPTSVVLARGKATVPLKGIDVPFHSALLRSMKELFRLTLIDGITKEAVTPETLVGKWIPNVVGTPFGLDEKYLKTVDVLTGSERVRALATELKARNAMAVH